VETRIIESGVEEVISQSLKFYYATRQRFGIKNWMFLVL
jgi:hypothetical protein